MSPHVLDLPAARSQAPAGALRQAAAAVLHGASASLQRLACRIAAPAAAVPRPDDRLPRVEFHAEAGALEGALYVDGQLIGMLPGVSRL